MLIRLAWWQSFVVRSVVDGNSSETPASLSYAAEVSKPFVEKTSTVDETTTGKEEHVGSTQPKRAAKIHDFCFGIPYGTFVTFSQKLISNLSVAELTVKVPKATMLRVFIVRVTYWC